MLVPVPVSHRLHKPRTGTVNEAVLRDPKQASGLAPGLLIVPTRSPDPDTIWQRRQYPNPPNPPYCGHRLPVISVATRTDRGYLKAGLTPGGPQESLQIS